MTKKKKEVAPRQKTYVAIVLDRSGSMDCVTEETVSGFNAQVREAQKNAKEQDIFVSLVTFNQEVYEHAWNVPADEMQECTVSDYHPDGGTALRDGLGYAVDKLKKTTTPDDNTAYMVIVITDGQDNTPNQHYSWAQIAEMREALEKTGKWVFRFMGCDEQYIKKVAKDIGVRLDNCALWSNASSSLATKGLMRSAGSSQKYYAARARGIVMNASVDSDMECCMADYTSDADDVVVPPAPSIDLKGVPTPDIVHRTPSLGRGIHMSQGSYSLNTTAPQADWQSLSQSQDVATNQNFLTGKPVSWKS